MLFSMEIISIPIIFFVRCNIHILGLLFCILLLVNLNLITSVLHHFMPIHNLELIIDIMAKLSLYTTGITEIKE